MTDGRTRGSSFDPRQYWESRHAEHPGLGGVGYLGAGPFNEWMYRVRADVFRRAMRPLLPIAEKRVLDVGAGSGFWIREWMDLGAGAVVGADFSDVAVRSLREAFPNPTASFTQLDVANLTPEQKESLGTFDLISMIDVIYHVVDDAAYRRAFRNIAELLRPNGRLLFTENFMTKTARFQTEWHVCRTRHEIEAALVDGGLSLERTLPCFVLMNSPVDSTSGVAKASWRTMMRVARRSPMLSRALGGAIYPLERALTKVMRRTPSSSLAVAKRLG